jgi:hypothetical protein
LRATKRITTWATQNEGREYATSATVLVAPSAALPGRRAARSPSAMPTAVDRASAVPVSRMVAGSRRAITSVTGWRLANEVPRSPRSTLPA